MTQAPQDPGSGGPRTGQWTSGSDDDARQGPRPTGFPFPGVSGTTKGGVRYHVGGCCLPIPLGCLTVLALGAAAVTVTRSRRH